MLHGKHPFCVLEPPWGGGLGTTYDILVRFIGKRVVNFLLAFIELFSLGVTAEELLAKIDRKSAGGSVSAKFSRRRGRPPLIIFTRIVRPMNALQLCRWQFSHKQTFSRLYSSEGPFYTENGRFAFLTIFEGLIRWSSYAHWKACSGLPNSVNWTFFARCYGWGATSESIQNRRFRSNGGRLTQNFR